MAKLYKAACEALLGKGSGKLGSLCCLCLNSVEEDAISVNDRITLEFDPFHEDLIEEILARILVSVLGHSVTENMSVFHLVCKKCSVEAINSFKFIQNCRKNTKSLIEAVQDLTDSFETVSDNTDYKTLFVSVNPESKSIQQIYDLIKLSYPRKTALARFKFIENGAPNGGVATEVSQGHKAVSHGDNVASQGTNVASHRDNAASHGDNVAKSLGKRDTSTIFIKTHELVADPSKPKEYKCKVCFKIFPLSGNLRQHFFAQHFKKEFQCTECSKGFGTIGMLQTHMQLSHQYVECSECGKKLLNRASTLKRHLQSHIKGVKICHKCGRKYKKINDYEKHIAQDNCELPSRIPGNYICDYCNHRCSYKFQLAQHIRFEHRGEEGWVCQWCSKKYYSASSLKTHTLTHTKEKKWFCTQCGGKFVSKQSLTNHMRLHTGERPYKCEVCKAGFTSASRRKDHVERYHTEASFECDLCPAKYTARRSLVKHRKRHFELVYQQS